MHCHLYRVSTSLVPTTPPSPHPTPYEEHNVNLVYESQSTIPIITSTVYTSPQKSFRVKCRREGDAADVDTTDLAFEIFLDGVWIGGCTLKARDANTPSQSRFIVNEKYVLGLQVARTKFRPFMFTSNKAPSVLEILVRTGQILAVKKPGKAEKGLQDVASRNRDSRPVLLWPLLQRPDLLSFEPDSTSTVNEEEKEENPAKDWVEGLNSLGGGSVAISPDVVQSRELKRVDWDGLRNLVLFRFQCVVKPSVPEGEGAGWVMEENSK